MNKESISVIITTYERSEMFKPDNFLIKRAIQSVLDQTLKSEEIIIIVDGKSRYITSIVEEFNREDIIKIVQTQDKVGGNEARNIGIRAATGDIIALLDDDDEWLPEKLNKQILLYKSISEEQKIIFSPMYFGESKDNVSQISPYEVNENIANYVLERKGAIQTSTLLAPKNYF
ncbi:glycosyltransferase family 2 protein [Leuconostoc fallax]|uniref:glycosyltransferase family 2 protein n=1 Tax=Leuconostoc fallax TaxID=1251 RepID=UPI00020D9A7E|nr:glycosyltransferase [Leuconostoc fallax]